MAKVISQYFVEVPQGAQITNRKGSFPDQQSGKDISYDFNIQHVFIHTGDIYPHPFDLRLPDGMPDGYLPGQYLLTDFLVVKNGKLLVNKDLHLQAIKPDVK